MQYTGGKINKMNANSIHERQQALLIACLQTPIRRFMSLRILAYKFDEIN